MLQLTTSRIKIYILTVLFFTVIVPLIYVFKYAHLNEDDFTRAIWLITEFEENISTWYLTHNGRVINALLSYLPVYEPPQLEVTLIVNFLLNQFVVYLFINRLLDFLGFSLAKMDMIFVAVLIFILQITALPLIFEYYYWYAGATAYSFSFLTLLLSVYFAFGVLQERKYSFLFTVISCVVCAGNNELLILLLNFLSATFLIYCYVEQSNLTMKALTIQLFLVIISLIVIFSPGSINRQSHYEEGGDVLYALGYSFVSTFSLLINELKTVSSIFGLVTIILLCIYCIRVNSNKNSIKNTNPISLLALSLTAIFLLIYVPSYATGGLNYNKGRIANMVQIILLIFLFINFLNLLLFLRANSFKSNILSNKALLMTLGICSFISIYSSNNIRSLYFDLHKENFQKLIINKENRIIYIKKSKENVVTVPPYSGTSFFPQDDMSADPNNWYNKSYLDYLKKKYNVTVNQIIVK